MNGVERVIAGPVAANGTNNAKGNKIVSLGNIVPRPD